MNNEIDSITERAKKYAKETTSTRCALMGKDGCGDCLRSERGDCDYRARVDAYLQGCDDTLRIILTYGETFNSKFI